MAYFKVLILTFTLTDCVRPQNPQSGHLVNCPRFKPRTSCCTNLPSITVSIHPTCYLHRNSCTDLMAMLGAEGAMDIEKMQEWAEKSQLDPNDPSNASFFYFIKVWGVTLGSKNLKEILLPIIFEHLCRYLLHLISFRSVLQFLHMAFHQIPFILFEFQNG